MQRRCLSNKVFLYFKKKYLRYFNVKTSSPHEGTNFGIKEHATAILPSHKNHVAGQKLSLLSSMKGTDLDPEPLHSLFSSLWSWSPTVNQVTRTLAKSIESCADGRTQTIMSVGQYFILGKFISMLDTMIILLRQTGNLKKRAHP